MQFIYPYVLLTAVPLVILIFLIIKKNNIKINLDKEKISQRKRLRKIVGTLRIFTVVFLVVALAQPYTELRTQISGNPKLTILIDNSTSMDVFSLGFLPRLKQQLEDKVPVKIRFIAHEKSDIGDGILANIEEDESLLLVSDGQNTEGTILGEVGLFASRLNSTINSIVLEPKTEEHSIVIEGPQKVVEDVENNYRIKVYSLGTRSSIPVIKIDGIKIDSSELAKKESNGLTEFNLRQKFKKGYHTIEASIPGDDHFPQNSVYYKSINAINKPKVAYVTSKDDPIELILDDLYSVEKKTSVPSNLEEYYAVLLNDMPVSKISNTQALTDYLIEGNGLVVVGGPNAFDGGGYKDSLFESMLPVRVGSAEKRRGSSNIVIVIDISGGIGETYKKGKFGQLELTEGNESLSLAKGLAISVIEDLAMDNSVGVIAFNSDAYKVAEIKPLYQSKPNVIDKVSRLKTSGQSYFDVGMRGAFELIKGVAGNKAVILITDGYTFNEGIRENTRQAAAAMSQKGIKTFTVGIGGTVDDKFLQQVAYSGEGIYFSADESNRLKILFGETDDSKKNAGVFGLFVLNSHHFITRSMKPTATLHSINQVIPKSSGRLLMTTDSGEPFLTVWPYGLGRVAALTGFSGNNLGQLLNKKNSILLSRTINWAIGDPERKNQYQITALDTNEGEHSSILVRTDIVPSFKGYEFIKIDKFLYRAEFIPEKKGFNKVLGATYAVNYPEEYERIGQSPALKSFVESTGGKIFESPDADSISEHVKAVAKRAKIKKRSLADIFVIMALVAFLLDVAIRKWREYSDK